MKWTNDIDYELKKLLNDGKRHEEISIILNTTVGSIKGRAFKLGLKVEYYKEYTCKNCNKIFKDLIITDRSFCCSSCSAEFTNKLKEKTNETKNKTRYSVNSYYLKQGKEKTFKKCEKCGNEFLVKKNKANRFCSIKCIDRRITDETKEKISKKRLEYLSSNKNVKWHNVKNIDGQNIKIQGKWELDFANRCNELNILFSRHTIKFKNCHHYIPDFYLPKYNIYVEIKGYLYSKDIYKMLNVIEEHKISLKMINDHNIIINFKDADELIQMENFEKKYSYDKINYDDFIKRY